jgi:hypothetical protein
MSISDPFYASFPTISRFFAHIICALTCATFGTTCYSQTVPAAVRWVQTERLLTLGEPVTLRLLVDNSGDGDVLLRLGSDFTEGLSVSVVTSNGSGKPRPTPKATGFHQTGNVRVPAKTHYSREFIIDEWYDFEAPGTYEVRVNLRSPIALADGSVQIAPPGVLIFDVAAPNNEALRGRCESLSARVVNAIDVEDAMVAAKALGVVRDPTVVPYLVRALNTGYLAPQSNVLRALGRFPTIPQAVDALIGVALGSTLDASWAKYTLLTAASQSEDRDMRNRIYAALGEPMQK